MQAPSEMAEQHSICWQKNKIMLVRKHHLHIYSGSRERPFTLGFYSKAHIMCLSIWKKGLTPLNKQTWNREAWPKEYHAWFHVKVGCFHCGWGYGVSLKQYNSGPEESLWDSQLVSIPDSFPHLCHWSGLTFSVLLERSSCSTISGSKSNKPFILSWCVRGIISFNVCSK